MYNGVWENKDEQHMVPALKELRRNVSALEEAGERLLLIRRVGNGGGSVMAVTLELTLRGVL